MRIKVNTPWFDDMDFRLNTFSISSEKRNELMEVEQTGYQIVAALTPNAAGMQPGKEIGEVLNKMLADVLEEPSHNEKEYLMRLWKQMESHT